MKITVDEEKCCAAGQCVLIAPEVFDQRDEDGIVRPARCRARRGAARRGP